MPPDRRSPVDTGKHFVGSRTVETSKEQGGRRRGRRGRGTVAQIHRTATERQQAWLETGQPNLTHQLTEELDCLFGDLRDERKGALGQPFYGRTWVAK